MAGHSAGGSEQSRSSGSMGGNAAYAFSDLDAIVVVVGNPDDTTVYQKSTALHFWFFGYEFPETLLGIQPHTLSAVTSAKKVSILETLERSKSPGTSGPQLNFFKRSKDGSDQMQLFEEFLSSLKKHSPTGRLEKIGIFSKDHASGSLAADWKKFMAAHADLELIDVSSAVGALLVQKDSDEQELIHQAAKSSSSLLQGYVTDQILSVIDADKRAVTHSDLSEKIENAVAALSEKRAKFKVPSGVEPEHIEMCYPPIIQSGGNYSLKPSAVSDGEPLHPGAIVCSLGLRYRSYCSNVGRTFLIDPIPQQETDYKFLEETYDYLLSQIHTGLPLASIYTLGHDFVNTKRPDLEKSWLSTIGWSTGLEFREPDYIIGAKSTAKPHAVCDGMTLILMVGFANIHLQPKKQDPRANLYSLMISDTVLIQNGTARVLTECTRKLSDISYFFKSTSKKTKSKKTDHADESIEEIDDSDDDAKQGRTKMDTPVGRKIRTRSRTGHAKVDEEAMRRREAHQSGLLKKLVRDSLLKYTQEEEEGKDPSSAASFLKTGGSTAYKEIECYKKEAFLPKAVRDLKILVDAKNDCVVLPIFGLPVPFHVSTIKNVSKSEEGEFVYLRINFNSPAGDLLKSSSFVRSLSFRSTDSFHMLSCWKELNDLRKTYTTKEAESRERRDIVAQDALVEHTKSAGGVRERSARLQDLFMRPAPWEGKRVPGDLDVHANGVRYRSLLKPDVKIDILFSNMKHLFFQPCDNEMIVVIHMHLHHPIMIGKKKTKDIQFYREALENIVDETSTSSNSRRRVRYGGGGDEDEIIQEQEERRRRAVLNQEFKSFCERLEGQVSVDIPIRDLGFYGVPFRQTVLLMPTRDALIHLTDPPFLVVTLADVEVASLERILFGLKHFDLVFIWKDHSRAPQHVDSIPVSYLEAIRAWLDAADIYTMTSTINFNWINVMKTIQDDPIGFYEMGGWSIIQARPGGKRKDGEDDGKSEASSSSSDDDDSVYDEESEDENGEESDEIEEDASDDTTQDEEESDFDDDGTEDDEEEDEEDESEDDSKQHRKSAASSRGRK
ncbi:FACT complex subunit spt16 [Mitosporidium daphniae]